MVVLNKKAFRLPRVDPEMFKLLMRFGLSYDRDSGTFRVANTNNIEKLVEALVEVLKDKSVCFTQSCLMCGKDFPCQECRYYELCDTRNMPLSCVCGKCLEEGKALLETH
jgi:hypothetical protein